MKIIVGVDEVGRGCLFGPVVSAAVSFTSKDIPEGLTDSKKLTAKKREKLSAELLESSHLISIGLSSAEEIDNINILQAALLSMKRAVDKLNLEPSKVFEVRVDGNFKIPNLDPLYKQVPIVQGDLHDQTIAAASIIAKVYRDRLIAEMDEEYPGYELAKHKGYPTKAHKAALLELGPTSQHRKTFKGVPKTF